MTFSLGDRTAREEERRGEAWGHAPKQPKQKTETLSPPALQHLAESDWPAGQSLTTHLPLTSFCVPFEIRRSCSELWTKGRAQLYGGCLSTQLIGMLKHLPSAHTRAPARAAHLS